jgi:SAM-dependent methyltransferase
MLCEARAAYPGIDVREDSLPDLASAPDEAYANALCSAVLMHLPRDDLIAAVLSLARVLRPGGRLVLTYRPSQTGGDREADGRLFTPIPRGKLVLLLESAGFQVLLATQQPDTARPAVTWTAIVAEKSPLLVARGLDRVQSILAQDRKVATYKLALVRALCAVSRTEAHAVHWGNGVVYVPLWPLAVRWLGERPDSAKPIAFRGVLRDLAARFGHDGLYAVLRDIEEHPTRYRAALKKISDTIRAGPVTYAGTGGPKVFGFSSSQERTTMTLSTGPSGTLWCRSRFGSTSAASITGSRIVSSCAGHV